MNDETKAARNVKQAVPFFGVASMEESLRFYGPHTQTTLRHIQELKKKHGIDYDSHASYRFAEE